MLQGICGSSGLPGPRGNPGPQVFLFPIHTLNTSTEKLVKSELIGKISIVDDTCMYEFLAWEYHTDIQIHPTHYYNITDYVCRYLT